MQFIRRHPMLSFTGLSLLLVGAILASRTIGPHRSYRADAVHPGPGAAPPAARLEAGVAIRYITPDLARYDAWTDADGDGRYDPDKGDTYEDRNGNGKFDAVWLAGFSVNRPAQGVHDPLEVGALALRNNGVTIALVTIDSIGITHEHFIDVRKAIAREGIPVDHVVFSTTHNHEAPDTMGIWSYNPLWPRFDTAYLEWVKRTCAEAVAEAAGALEPADLICAQVAVPEEGYVGDTRLPHVIDPHMNLMRFVRAGTDETLATFVNWGNHVETLGSNNNLITADFVHYLREGIERGVPEPYGVSGLGGECLYFQGMVGGLMTQLRLTVPHRDGVREFREASFEKAQALGENVAVLAVRGLTGPDAWRVDRPVVAVAAKTVFAPIDGIYTLPIMFGLIHPGWYWGRAKSEVDAIRIGDVEMLAIPGEIYPEIVMGGIESPEGADYPGPPVEVPPLYERMQGRMNLVLGLANDEIGYIIPRTQWDTKPPYAYGQTDEPQYGEQNSGGSRVAEAVHRGALDVLEQLHGALAQFE